jgi:hypothetical protein
MVDGGQLERGHGFPDRDAINPFQVLQELAPAGSHFTYSPGIDWIGSVVPASALAPGLTRTESDSGATRVDPTTLTSQWPMKGLPIRRGRRRA